MTVANKTTLITGASGGIGSAIAQAFASHDATVVLNDLDQSSLDEVATDLRETGATVYTTPGDVSDPDTVSQLTERARDRAGSIDILVNNAGIYPRRSLENESWDSWNHTLQVNAGSVFNFTREIAPAMADRGTGAIINMSSTAAIRGSPNSAAYAASKGAIRSVTQQLCREFGPRGLRINAILPGPIKTPLNASVRQENGYMEFIEETVPTGRMGTPSEVADLAVFLASDRASFINGASIVIDGGWTA